MLLAMQHQTIPATPNYTSPNASIALAHSPFVLRAANQAWDTPAQQPRLGTVSTTGISGTNAHVVLEEYVPEVPQRSSVQAAATPRLIVLSARTSERLQAVARQMLQYVEHHSDLSMADLAYTLQVGRDAMAARLALVVRHRGELVSGLQHYLAHAAEPQRVAEADRPVPLYTGNLDESPTDIQSLLAGSAGEGLWRGLLAEKNLPKLALYWARGGTIPWAALHEDGPFRLLALPTYPFARERYWVQPDTAPQHGAAQPGQADDTSPARQAAALGATAPEAAVVAAEAGDFVVHAEQSVRQNMQRYMVWFLCQDIGLTPDQVTLGKGLRSYGVDSISSARLIRGFEKFFQLQVTSREIVEHSTIGALVAYLAEKVEARRVTARPTPPAPANGAQARAEYLDAQVLQALEQLEQGTLDLEAVQRFIAGSATV
jgi:acyl transferase domain-containing protein